MNRRKLLKSLGLGFTGITLGQSFGEEFRKQIIHHTPTAENVIFIHMLGGPSQLDTFDYKPALEKYAGKSLPASLIKDQKFAFIEPSSAIMPSIAKFKQYGQSGTWLSDLLPNFQKIVDDITIIRSVHTDEFNHASGELFMHTGFGRLGRPSLGSWINFALGSNNLDLPTNIVLSNGTGAASGINSWSNGFLPGKFQGVKFRNGANPVLYLKNPEKISSFDRKNILDAVVKLNLAQFRESNDPSILTRSQQFDMASRMQISVPEAVDLTQEPDYIKNMYGIQGNRTPFAKNCLLARRMVERDVRFIQLMNGGWDHHKLISKSLPKKCASVDKPLTGLILDLKQRGLLDKTLVVCLGEFGRTPMTQGVDGRDHHNSAFTIWMAGGGIKRGYNYGKTDEFGFAPVENPVHVHDLHATILHTLGVDHKKLTYRYQGRDFRLTDVHGRIVKKILI